MKKNITQIERLAYKTKESRISNYFEKRYKFSPVISEALTSDTLFFNTVFGQDKRDNGQIIYYAVSNKEPAGKPLKDCQYINIILTLRHSDDAKYRAKHNMKKLKLRIMQRICDEAVLQGACLSYEDISELMYLDRTTVGLYMKELIKCGIYVQTRANFTDQGRKYTHKEQIIKLYLIRLSNTEISQRTNHNLNAVENYIKDFLKIIFLYLEKKHKSIIRQFTGKSLSLIQEYIDLYNKLKNNEYYTKQLTKKILFYQTDMRQDLTKFNISPFKKKSLKGVKI
ncbi:MAG: DUF1670 domain-containing protein [Candidatus Omnitrophica bacterium]|nr:DUF1670 domain-containing protein [Candidatus Omnitrophota bacterium]